MGCTSEPLIPITMSVSSSNNSFVSGWGDKRSGTTAGVSLVFYGTNAPDGYAWIETSNAIVVPGSGFAAPYGNGDDAAELADSQQSVTLNVLTGLYTVQWQLANLPARWVRVRYTASANVAGLTANIYLAVPHESGL